MFFIEDIIRKINSGSKTLISLHLCHILYLHAIMFYFCSLSLSL
ncbi:unnamed protein product, partial [Prunus brigantina]